MSKNQLAVSTEINLNQIQAIGQWGLAEINTLKETIGKDCTVPQFNLFMYQVNRMGLDPFLKQAFPIVYGGKLDIRVAYEGFLSKAKECPDYEGVFNQVVCENETDDFEAETDDEGVITKIRHKVRFPRGKVVGAYSIAKRKGARDVIILMEASEVMKYAKNNGKFWKLDDGSIDPDMFKKHVGTRAVKAQFNIAAVVDESGEFITPAASDEKTYERRDITTEAEQMVKEQQQVSKPESPANDEETKLQEARQQMADKFQALGITDPEEMGKYIAQHAKPKGKKPTLAEMMGLLKIMDMHIEEKMAAETDKSGDDLLDDELMAALE
ncbi:RecT family recombinase [Paenibacillus ehimensis]|uniref:RecT family recombinase n=1 Tax=Paenibacillus ehimensis TaxID=79264 RepID=UPI003D2D0EAF